MKGGKLTMQQKMPVSKTDCDHLQVGYAVKSDDLPLNYLTNSPPQYPVVFVDHLQQKNHLYLLNESFKE